MSKRRKRKLNNLQGKNSGNNIVSKSQGNNSKADDYDFKNAVYPDNSRLKIPSDYNRSDLSEGDIVMHKAGKDAVIGEYNFINVAIIFVVIMLIGLSFALLRNTGEYVEKDNKISAETVLNGNFTKKLSKNYIKRLPGKQLLLDTNRCLSYVYGLGSFNDEKGFVSADTGRIINIKTYENPVFVTLATKPTVPPTTTQYTGKTTNTTVKLNKTLFVGPGQLTTTKKTKKTKKTTTTKATTTTTAFTGTTWSFKGTTTTPSAATTTTTTTTPATSPTEWEDNQTQSSDYEEY